MARIIVLHLSSRGRKLTQQQLTRAVIRMTFLAGDKNSHHFIAGLTPTDFAK